MASNTARGFKCISSFEEEDTMRAVIAASQTIYLGDALFTGDTGHTKFVAPADTTSEAVIGVCVALEGVPGGHLPEIGSEAGVASPGSVAAGSGNETTPVYYARFIPMSLGNLKFAAQLTATAGTTTDSDGIGSFSLKTTNAGQLDETSIQLFSTVPAKQFFSYGLDSTDNNKFTVIGYFSKYFI